MLKKTSQKRTEEIEAKLFKIATAVIKKYQDDPEKLQKAKDEFFEYNGKFGSVAVQAWEVGTHNFLKSKLGT